MLEAIPETQEEATANRNRKRKKAAKDLNRKKNLEIIPEEESFENEIERKPLETVEAFDAISVARKHENNPQLANGFTNFSVSPQPSTSYAAPSMTTTSNYIKSKSATTKGGRNKV